MDEERAGELLAELKELADAFVQLVMTTKVVTSKALNKTCIVHSARFIAMINKRATPMMSAFFRPLNGQITALLKSLQPATRLLQVHCTMVKEQQQLAALAAAAQLKRELEGLIFKVKVMLQANDVREGFWMGNLKHKNLHGQETSSQLAVVPPPDKGSKGKKRKKAAEEEEEEEEEEVMGGGDEEEEPIEEEPVEEMEGDEEEGEEDLEDDDEY
jgi:Fanconi anemia group D2 protein